MDLKKLLSRWSDEKAREREEKEKREAEERQRKDATLKDLIHRLRGEKPIEQPATQEQPDSTGSYSWWKTAEDAEAKENIKNFLDFIRK